MDVLLIGTNTKTWFTQTLQDKTKTKIYYANKNILQQLEKREKIIIALHGMSRFAQDNYGLTDKIIHLINALCIKKDVILVIFGNPYSLKNFTNASTVICAYEDDKDAQIGAAKVVLGTIRAEGKLPITV